MTPFWDLITRFSNHEEWINPKHEMRSSIRQLQRKVDQLTNHINRNFYNTKSALQALDPINKPQIVADKTTKIEKEPGMKFYRDADPVSTNVIVEFAGPPCSGKTLVMHQCRIALEKQRFEVQQIADHKLSVKLTPESFI